MKRPLLYLAVFFSSGIAISSALKIPLVYPAVLSATLSLVSVLYSRKQNLSHVFLYLAVAFLGMSYYQASVALAPDDISNLASKIPEKIYVKGSIIDEPVTGRTGYGTEKVVFTLKVSAVKTSSPWRAASGRVIASAGLSGPNTLGFGDTIVMEGLPSLITGFNNPGVFNYARFMELRDIRSSFRVRDISSIETVGIAPYASLGRAAYSVRQDIRGVFDRFLDNYYSGFLKAIIIGDRSGLPDSLKDDFVKTGTVHIIAISGLNVALIAAMLMALAGLVRIPRRIALVLSAIILIFYSFIAGSGPPIIRSVIMFSVFVIGYLMQRETDLLNSLSAAALAILLCNPKELFDPSFQLSFASVAGIIILTPKYEAMFGVTTSGAADRLSGRLRKYLIKSVAVSLAAWSFTWPIVAAYFNMVSPVSILANLIAVPILFAMTALSFLLILVAPVWGAFAALVSGTLYLIERSLFFINHLLAGVPLAYFRMAAPAAWGIILYYAFLSACVISAGGGLGRFRIGAKEVLITFLAALNVIVWLGCAAPESTGMKVTFLDVGRGDCAFVELPGGANLLVDGGSGGKGEGFDAGRSVVGPYLWNKGIFRIDTIIVTHFHEDHLGGIISVLNDFKVKRVIDNGAVPSETRLYDEYIRTIRRKGIRRIVVREGDSLELAEGVKALVLNPPASETVVDSNENSLAVKLVYKNRSILFCADILERTVGRLMERYGGFLEADVIKVPHHGGYLGDRRTIETFFEMVSAPRAVISAQAPRQGKRNSDVMVDMITSSGSAVYSTKDLGAISFDYPKNN